MQNVSGQLTGHYSHYCRCCRSRNMGKNVRTKVSREMGLARRTAAGSREISMWLAVVHVDLLMPAWYIQPLSSHPDFRGGSEDGLRRVSKSSKSLVAPTLSRSLRETGEAMATLLRRKSICDRSSRTVSLTSGASCFVPVYSFYAVGCCV